MTLFEDRVFTELSLKKAISVDLNPTDGVLMKGKNLDVDAQGEHHVKMKPETRLMLL